MWHDGRKDAKNDEAVEADAAVEIHWVLRVVPPACFEGFFERNRDDVFHYTGCDGAAEEEFDWAIGEMLELNEQKRTCAVDWTVWAIQEAAVDEFMFADKR